MELRTIFFNGPKGASMGYGTCTINRISFRTARISPDRCLCSGSPAFLWHPECDALQTGTAWGIR